MNNDLLKNVAVIGAAGKMGSGIALLLLQEMARVEFETTGTVGSGEYQLYLIDKNLDALHALDLRSHMQHYAERTLDHGIESFVNGSLKIVRRESSIEAAKDAHLIFEAIVEDLHIKKNVLGALSEIARSDAYYFSNTSSIPIHVLNFNNRIIGYHFYNPPVVQKLLEIITYEGIDPDLVKIAEELAQRLGKLVVHSKDIAGFIGNGHLMREIAFACRKVEELDLPTTEAVILINRVTQVELVRPMGIFQLVDYVGLDVCQKVTGIMSHYLEESFNIGVVSRLIEAGRLGGQNLDGSQKPGFFEYDGLQPIAVYSFEEGKYVPYIHTVSPWKERRKEPHAVAQSELAKEFMVHSRQVAEKLLSDGVAKSIDDINTVLMSGFHHVSKIHLE